MRNRPVPEGTFRIEPADPRLVWTGRVLFRDGQARYDWPGVTLCFRFRGDSFLLESVDGGNDHDLMVDGRLKETWRTRSGETLKRVEGLGSGEHEVRLVKRTEASWGETLVNGLLLPVGARLLDPPPPSPRRLLVVGDSLACGYGIEGEDPLCPGCRGLENVTRSYAGLCAAELSAEAHIIAWSGKGLVRNYGAPGVESPDPIPLFWERTCAQRPEPAWNPAAYHPQVVILQLGSNDFSTEPSPEPGAWARRYEEFAREILRVYPGARLLCISRMGVPHLADAVSEAVRSMRGAGIPAGLVVWDRFHIREMGCDYHPNARAQRRMADQVMGPLRELVGWS